MDSLFHFVFAFVGGYILARGLELEISIFRISILAFLSLFIDISHIIGVLGLSHNVFVFIPLILIYLVFHKIEFESWKNYVLVFSVMVAGHLIADMIFGIGIPLLFPFSEKFYLIPQYGICLHRYAIYIAHGSVLVECLVTPFGTALALYFGIIGFLIFLRRYL